MTPDPIDQLGARLFESARNETIPEGAPERALEAARGEIGKKPARIARFSSNQKRLAAVPALALAAATVLLLRPKDTNLGISAEPSVMAQAQPEPRSAPPRSTPSSAPSNQAPPVAPSLAVSAKPRPSVQAMMPPAPATLSDELSALKVASSALSAGDPDAALSALDHYDRVLKGRKLRAEATLLRIEALSRAGQTQASSALAQRFVDQNPGSPLVDRARSFVVK